jgi:hypothetical protein
MAGKRLNLVSVPQPCPRTWHSMHGSETERLCDDCHKTVHNLSTMKRSEAERLLRTANGTLCVAFSRGADGRIVTSDRRARFSLRRPFDGLSAAALAAFIAVSQPAAALAARLGADQDAAGNTGAIRTVGQNPLRGVINGTVRDMIGEPMADATVTAHKDGADFTTKTDKDGKYVLLVPIGSYRVTAEVLGFNTFALDHIRVWWALPSRVDATLSVGMVGETVTVVGDGVLVDAIKAPVRAVRRLFGAE